MNEQIKQSNKDFNVEVIENSSSLGQINLAVTVNVITYNSSCYIIQCLNSIKEQHYPHIILQISDDCSTDNTIEVCRQWLDKNNKRFIKCKIITPSHNTGISANFNRAWDICETIYCKDIAGDDILLPNCISDCMSYVKNNPEIGVWFGRIKIFGCSDEVALNFISTYLLDYKYESWDKETMVEYFFKHGNCLPAASSFVNLRILKDKSIRHDERIPLLEDLPKWVNCLKQGVLFGYINNQTVGYRIQENSLSNGNISIRYNKSRSLYFLHYVYPNKLKKSRFPSVKNIIDEINYLHHYCIVNDKSKAFVMFSKICDSLLVNIIRFKQLISKNS